MKTIQVGNSKHILINGNELDEFGYTFAIIEGNSIELVRKDMFGKTERVYTNIKELKEMIALITTNFKKNGRVA